MKIKQIIKKILLNLKIKFPYYKEDYIKFNIQEFKKLFEKSKNKNNEISLENFFFNIQKKNNLSKSQLYQDILVDLILDKDNGFYCEVGACDGIVHSNSYFLENNRNWKGILCEPASFWIEKLKINRPNSIIETSPIFSNSNLSVDFIEKPGGRSFINLDNNPKEKIKKKNIYSISLNDLFDKYNVSEIDYLSIDTEGTEFEILKNFNLNKYRPKTITVEHNYKDYRKKIFRLLKKNNYKRIFKGISRFDDWYVDISIIDKYIIR